MLSACLQDSDHISLLSFGNLHYMCQNKSLYPTNQQERSHILIVSFCQHKQAFTHKENELLPAYKQMTRSE